MPDKLLSSGTLPDLGLPHRSDLFASRELPAYELISTAFVLLFDSSSRLLLRYADLPARGGWDLPGGHVEPGETPPEAAVRELREETGWPLEESALTVLGWNRIQLEGPKPDGFRYPHPTGYLAYFTTHLAEPGRPTVPAPDSECSSAAWLTPVEARAHCPNRRWLPLLDAVQGPA
ncbi:NUDIX hydrolase [Kribbella italica]|uniref:8-oxo-dGTP pyrophosphatase MutT (NUDIX family) n=1 Tax=Kribbella italica TaxID=1540520 RepID=A0A7W9MRH4_9ACTN|nr:NUDIX hydrolase [Kribbella italica]MBB5833534.1 8-oxo-dGTP pyrophosphatase MutT (NUDIX family) [Kribbella italica]